MFYVHASVNLLNSFLPEIAHLSLGSSKERVNRIEGVLKEMIRFLNDEKDITEIDLEPKELLEMPYSLEMVALTTGKKRRLQERQKLMRECRVTEACVNILYLPFATEGLFNFMEI